MSKIQSESNSQHGSRRVFLALCCGFYVKDTIWKQFTTFSKNGAQCRPLWFLCQRYNLKAIHNVMLYLILPKIVVVSMSKIQSESNSQQNFRCKIIFIRCGFYVKDTIWKQFTTLQDHDAITLLLWFLCQRYNLKAIHNSLFLRFYKILVVVSMSKIQSESNSQHSTLYQTESMRCGFYVKDTIWKQFTTQFFFSDKNGQLWFLCQRYNLKAIHNYLWANFTSSEVVVSMSKIQSESNSQPIKITGLTATGCGFYVKDTIWKQFTTIIFQQLLTMRLWFLCQRYNLKAIHNIFQSFS